MLKNCCHTILALMVICFTTAASSMCHADSIADTARKIADSYKEAIVTVEMINEVSMSYESESDKRESRSSATGVIVDPSGLVVTSLTACNPEDSAADLPDDSGFGITSKVMDAKIWLADGSEVSMDVVLRDRDLDMLFLRPKTSPATPFKCVDLTGNTSAQLMDQTLLFSRLGQIANRSLNTSLDRIGSVINKPRLSYILTGISAYNLGCPVFTADGKLLGITFVKKSVNRDVRETSVMARILPVTLPCSTIQNAATQALTAKPEKMAEPSVKKPAGTFHKPVKKPVVKPPAKTPVKPKK